MDPAPAIVTEGLRKRYGAKEALAGVDLSVPAGSVVGLLGPNGAGKTTMVRILATLLRPDGGTARVAGFDPVTQADEVRARIGLTGQQPTVDEVLTGRENLVLWARLHHLDRRAAGRRADELLEQFHLTADGATQVKHYSGGMRRRLDLAAGFVLAPEVLFLDEPTTGLDPRNRADGWDAIRDLVARGTTVLLTTQYLEEADQLADLIAVIDDGRVIAEGSPGALKTQVGGDRLEVVVGDGADVPTAASILERLGRSTPDVSADDRRISVAVGDRVAGLVEAVRALGEAGVAVDDIGVRRPTLDDVFLQLTGRRADHGPTTADGAPRAAATTDEEAA